MSLKELQLSLARYLRGQPGGLSVEKITTKCDHLCDFKNTIAEEAWRDTERLLSFSNPVINMSVLHQIWESRYWPPPIDVPTASVPLDFLQFLGEDSKATEILAAEGAREYMVDLFRFGGALYRICSRNSPDRIELTCTTFDVKDLMFHLLNGAPTFPEPRRNRVKYLFVKTEEPPFFKLFLINDTSVSSESHSGK